MRELSGASESVFLREAVLEMGEVPIAEADGEVAIGIQGDGEGLCVKWVPIAQGAILPQIVLFGDGSHRDPFEMRNEILRQAREVGAEKIVWKNMPLPYDLSYSCVVASLFRAQPTAAPATNDGRSSCFWCGARTERRQGFTAVYDICPDCRK